MKHHPDPGQDTAGSERPQAVLPDPDQCEACRFREADCTRLAFGTMTVIAKYPDGITFVDCRQFQAS